MFSIFPLQTETNRDLQMPGDYYWMCEGQFTACFTCFILSHHTVGQLPLFDQAGAPEEFDVLALPLFAPPIFVPSREKTLGLSMLPSPLLSRPPLPFSFSPPFSLLPSRLLTPPPPSLPPAFRLLPLPDFEDMALTWNKEILKQFYRETNSPDDWRFHNCFVPTVLGPPVKCIHLV